ncbi:cilia- and flagella-associated protein 119 [Genypterus blacodes]|uniref:cilia- and flagella-associated protein 119 n=1 Tax=Genypterus blacodes TaxID=154954 RepID=UPI003F76099C
MDAKLKVPLPRKAKVKLWTDVSYHDMEEIDKLQSIPELESALCRVFASEDVPEPRRGILLELYVQTLLFCRRSGFTKEQTSALLSIIRSIHEVNTETLDDNTEQCLEYCKDLLLCHSVRRPPFSVALFSGDRVTSCLEYIYSNYMRHSKLYKYTFIPQLKLDLSFTYPGMPEEEEEEEGEDPTQDSSVPVPDDEAVMENEAGEVEPEKLPETKEASPPEAEGAAQSQAVNQSDSPCSKSELKEMIEKEVGQQMALLSAQLEKRMKEMASGINVTLEQLSSGKQKK